LSVGEGAALVGNSQQGHLGLLWIGARDCQRRIDTSHYDRNHVKDYVAIVI
jgi:hypothetical protein